VHTSVRQHFGWLDAVARTGRAGMLRNYLKLDVLTPDDVGAEIEAYAANQWRTRADIVAHIRTWLAERESRDSAAALSEPSRRTWSGGTADWSDGRATSVGRSAPISTINEPAACCPTSPSTTPQWR
jgi:hypothetical protein